MIILGWECPWSRLNYSHGLEMLLHNEIGQLQCLQFINPTGLPFVQYLCSRIIHGPFNDCCVTNNS